MATEVLIYKMSEHQETATIIRWLVKEGEEVAQFQVILEVETDKVNADVEAPASGVLKGVRVGAIEGAVIPVGETIAFIAAPDEEVPTLPPLDAEDPNSTASARVETAPLAAAPPVAPEQGQIPASPAARRVAKELLVDVALVPGTGPDGRVTEGDVRAFAISTSSGADPAASSSLLAGAGAEDEWLELTATERVTGQRMVESTTTAPQFWLSLSVDMTNVLAWRDAAENALPGGEGKPSVTALLVKMVADVLARHPRVNASFENGRVRLHQSVNVGVAIGGADGLVVPVVKGADRASVPEVSYLIRAYQETGRGGRFRAEDLEAGTFTISNLGMYGIERFNAIVNPPQGGILAVGSVLNTPVAREDGTVALRPMMNLTLTLDHRVMDGIHGARFLAELKERLESPVAIR